MSTSSVVILALLGGAAIAGWLLISELDVWFKLEIVAPRPDGPPPPGYGPEEPPQPYSYQYGVHDEYSGANFAANENSDTKVVSGTYTVSLPDGRIQTVKYTADDYTGYVADVTVSISK